MIKFESYAYNDNELSDYFEQIKNNKYYPLNNYLWDNLQLDGYPEELNDYDKNNYKYTTLNISDVDKNGLINFNDDILEKWNDFDIKLKDNYFPNYIDYIDYENGIVYIIKYKKNKKLWQE